MSSTTYQFSMWTLELMATILILLTMLALPVEAQTNTHFAFPNFTIEDEGQHKIKVVGDAVYNFDYSSYDLNNAGNESDSRAYTSCGRMLFRDQVWLVDQTSHKVASFNSSFTFAFVPDAGDPTYCGDGLAFTFLQHTNFTAADYNNRRGGGLCLLDFHDESPANRVFAVEFDSYNNNLNYSDPSDSHIGVDVNSKSLGHYDLCQSGLLGGPRNTSLNQSCNFYCRQGQDFTAWIDYDSAGGKLEVRFVVGNGGVLGRPAEAVVTVNNLWLNGVLDERMYVGFSASTGRSRRIHRVKAWEFVSSGLMMSSSPGDARRMVSGAIIGGVSAAGVVVFLLGFCLLFLFKRRRERSNEKLEQLALGLTETSRAFTYRELSWTTKNFSESERLSSGAFGDVYKGTLRSGTLVAVKRIKENKELGEESFLAEATSLRQIRHRNLLQLRGWCHSKEGLLLVYDYMCNGSLDKWLHRSPARQGEGLSWNLRRFVLSGVASGLAYLHEEWVQCVLHRDIKSSNVMLDANFNAYLGDFGLARLVDHQKLEKTTLLAGTLGYMAPEMIHTGRATKDTDVYAFGILVLEVVSGRRPLHQDALDEEDSVLIDSVWRAHEAGNVVKVADPTLFESQFSSQSLAMEASFQSSPSMMRALDERKMIADVLQVGLQCCLPDPSERPSMRVVNQWFQASEGVAMDIMPSSLPAAKPYSQYSVPLSSRNSSSLQTSLATLTSCEASLCSNKSTDHFASR